MTGSTSPTSRNTTVDSRLSALPRSVPCCTPTHKARFPCRHYSVTDSTLGSSSHSPLFPVLPSFLPLFTCLPRSGHPFRNTRSPFQILNKRERFKGDVVKSSGRLTVIVVPKKHLVDEGHVRSLWSRARRVGRRRRRLAEVQTGHESLRQK